MEVSLQGKKKRQRRTAEWKEAAVKRLLAGEPIVRVSRELKVMTTVLHRWRESYQNQGLAGLRGIGRPAKSVAEQGKANESEITKLQSKIGQQTMVIDFLRRAFKRVEELRRSSTDTGVTASTRRSRQ
jgi:transposase-like protein